MTAAAAAHPEPQAMMHSVVTHLLFMSPKLTCSTGTQRHCVANQDIKFNELLVCEHVIASPNKSAIRFLVERNETLFNSLYPREHPWSEEWSRPPSGSGSSRRRKHSASSPATAAVTSSGVASGAADSPPQDVIALKPNYLLADLAAKKVDLNVFTDGVVTPKTNAVDGSSVAGGAGSGPGSATTTTPDANAPLFLLGDKVSIFNHCCTPNTIARSFPLRVADGCVMTILAVFAVEGIKSGQELSLNYSAQHTGGGTKREGRSASTATVAGSSPGGGSGGAGEDVMALAAAEGLLDCTCSKTLEERLRRAGVIKRLAKAMHKREALSLIFGYLSQGPRDDDPAGLAAAPHHHHSPATGAAASAPAPLIINNVMLVEDKVATGRGGGGGSHGSGGGGGAAGIAAAGAEGGGSNHLSSFATFVAVATRQYFGLKGLYDAGMGTDDDVTITQRALTYYNEKTAGPSFVRKHSESLSRFQDMLEHFQGAALVEMEKTRERSATRKKQPRKPRTTPTTKKPRKECLVVQAPPSLR
jgi:hypothetical protein